MDNTTPYQIFYTDTAVADIEEKADYIQSKFRDSQLAETWYLRLREEIQQDLSFLPCKYQLYDTEPWKERGVRLFLTRNDVVLYSVDEEKHLVYIRGICTRGRDMTAHLAETE